VIIDTLTCKHLCIMCELGESILEGKEYHNRIISKKITRKKSYILNHSYFGG
jgi:hypothetical protein